jgi:hypothetical protein
MGHQAATGTAMVPIAPTVVSSGAIAALQLTWVAEKSADRKPVMHS